MKTLLLKLKGPMQSYGTSSHFETRQTDYYPSKSAIIGIIAASFGYKRDNDEKINQLNNLDFAVRIDQEGVLSRDFHTASKYKKNGKLERNYVTNRYYMEDAVYVVAISHKDEDFIDKIRHALSNPYYQPFMGRRSCPIPADFIIKSINVGPIEALEKLEWQASDWYKRKHKNYIADIYADKGLIDNNSLIKRNDSVISFSQKNRKFGPRFEARDSKLMSYSDDIDFFEHI